MAILKAHWLPHEDCTGNPQECKGGEVKLAPIPIAGQREIKELELEDAAVKSLHSKFRFIAFCNGALAADRVLKTLGAAKAKEAWDDHVLLTVPRGETFIWPVEKFADSLQAIKKDFCYKQLACKDDDELKQKLEEYSKETLEDAKKVKLGAVESLGYLETVMLYWRLRDTGIKTILTAEGPKPIDWGVEAERKKKALAILFEVANDEHFIQLVDKPKRAFDMEVLKPLSVADVEGKSQPTSTASTQSSADSPPSSASTTETDAKSE